MSPNHQNPPDQNGGTGEPSAGKAVPAIQIPMPGTGFAAEGSLVPPLQRAGLTPRPGSPAEVRPLPDGPLHFVGIGGAGQSAIAYVLAQRGRVVRGSDPGISPTAKARLESVGCTVYTAHTSENLATGTAAVIATDAVNEQNPEVAEALSRGIPVFRRPEALAYLINTAKTAICVAGTHGKTTTTGMIASILIHAGLNPTVLIGGDLPLIGGNSQNGDPELVVAEACEAYGGLDCLSPTIAVITNCEPDHLDFHGSEENFYAAFIRFINQTRHSQFKDWEGILAISDIPSPLRDMLDDDTLMCMNTDNFTYGLTNSAFVYPEELILSEKGSSFYREWNRKKYPFTLRVPGEHNVLNGLGAICATLAAGVSHEDIALGLESFTGTGRRFERLGTARDIAVVDDYAHHPTEIRATLQAARQAYPDRRIVAIYQPHLPSRTRDFLDAFGDALAGADALYLTDIYLAREPEQPGLIEELLEKVNAISHGRFAPSPRALERFPSSPVAPPSREEGQTYNDKPASLPGEERTIRGREMPEPCEGGEMAPQKQKATLVKDRHALPAHLARELKPGDLALFMGAGNIREQAEELLKML